ncbi:hypothetical protein [Pseudokineococcus lusitanus]|nr:hypothetical protein [Pseudokineococcus lusitanus]
MADDPVPAGVPSWCRLLVVGSAVAAGPALLGGGARHPSTVLVRGVVTSG